MDKHVVIVGSGLGGLTCGYILAKNGYRVSVLEKNAQLGGCLQNFVRRGVRFETGMHYIGSMEEGQTLYKLFRYLSLLPDVSLRPLDKNAYDLISIAGERFAFANGKERFVESLAKRFPAERSSLQRYVQTIEDVAGQSAMVSLRQADDMVLLNPAYVKQSASEFVESATNNKLLQQVLAGNLPLYAGVKGKTPLYIHALINSFYNQSACRIVGGSDAIARSLVRSIRAMGGSVRSCAKVVAVRCNDSRATGAALEDGEVVSGDYFISNIHPLRTVELLDTHLIRKSYRQRIAAIQNTISNFTVYIRFKKNAVPYLNSNLYHYNEPNVWEVGGYRPSAWPGSFLYMHHCSSIEQQHADSAILMSYMSFEEVARWKGTQIGQRGDEYEDFKQQKAERMLDELEKQMPGTRASIEQYYTSTPLTYMDYTGTENGSMYGIVRDCNELMQTTISPRTKIPNLLQVGQNINSHGALGVVIGAIITAGELLGVGAIMRQIQEAQQ
ncbi:MAG: NAD(P)/FAD-dependent oxidoreductase [Prevotellaceae bacterium]|jgi:all-trans-retinol 13,14-reductase|nr:NAD(P)/FAD-dependent oxidoreductase [Prevotellaceae bacterium]